MTSNEKNTQALKSIYEIRNYIRREIYIQTLLNTNKPYEECYSIADTAALNYIKSVCDNNEMYDVIEKKFDDMESNVLQYAYLAAGGLNTPANEISE